MKVENYIDKGKMKISFISTIVFMLMAYMYAYTNGSFLFDAAFIYRGEEPYIVRSDKWVSPLLGILDAHINAPWLAGMLSMAFMAVAVYCIVEVFQIKSKLCIVLISGLCCTQSSIICQQEYAGGNYTGETALMFACLAVWSIIKFDNAFLKICVVSLSIAISAGTYGAYIGMVPSMLMLVLILDIMKGKEAKENWKSAMGYAFLFLVGMIIYYVILRFAVRVTGSQLQSYMGEENLSNVSGIINTIHFIPGAYLYILQYYAGMLDYLPDSLNKLMVCVLVLGAILSVVLFIKYGKYIKNKKSNILLLTLIMIFLPIAINLIYVLASGSVHFLMIFTYINPFIFLAKELDFCIDKKRGMEYKLAIVISAVISVFLYNSIVMANAVMVHLNHMFIEAQSICTTMLARIENAEGFDGTEDVVLIGAIQYNDYFQVTKETEAEILDAFLGPGNANNVNGVNWGSWLSKYLSNILNSSLDYSYYDSLNQFIEANSINENVMKEIERMSDYPLAGSVKEIDDVIYVYLGEE